MSGRDTCIDPDLYESVFDASGDGLVLADRTSTIIRANRRFLRMTRYGQTEVEGVMQWSQITGGGDLAALAVTGTAPAIREMRLQRKDGSFIDAAVTVRTIPDRGLFIVSILDITGKKQVAQALHRRDVILEAISTMAGRFLAAPAWEEEIVRALRSLCTATEVHRVYLFENITDPETGETLMKGRYEWDREGHGGEITTPWLKGLSYQKAGVGEWEIDLRAGKTVFASISDAEETEKQNMEALGVQSVVIVPIHVGGRWWGFIGFDETRQGRHWTEVEIDTLGAAAGIIGSAIHRQETEEAMLAYITESALRLKNPVALLRENIESIYDDIREGSVPKEEILAQIRVQIAAAGQIAENLRELNASIAEGRREIPEAFRIFLRR
ncbi:PAS domain S-box protein [uncultured Methanofollis sp.]|uniref:PAS domain S-box protein n=1 Tax=uncultured Methanofollis sp. TaxID=262500 RepID=UPI0026263B17|nr:PAS domain S-box protein [uncultured Methanofollis sp.]